LEEGDSAKAAKKKPQQKKTKSTKATTTTTSTISDTTETTSTPITEATPITADIPTAEATTTTTSTYDSPLKKSYSNRKMQKTSPSGEAEGFLNRSRKLDNILNLREDKALRYKKAKEWINEMDSQNVPIDVYHYNRLISLWAEENRSEEVNELLKRFEEEIAAKKRKEREELGLETSVDRRADLLWELHNLTCRALLLLAAREGRSEDAEEMLQELIMRYQQHTQNYHYNKTKSMPDGFVFNSLISMWIKKDSIENAESIFAFMKENDIEISGYTCSPLFQYYVKHNATKKAEELFELAKSKGWKLPSYTLTTILNMWLKFKENDKAGEVVRLLEDLFEAEDQQVVSDKEKKNKVQSSVAAFNALLRYYISIDEARRVQDLMNDNVDKYNRFTYSLLISYYSKKDDTERVDQLYQKMLEMEANNINGLSKQAPFDLWTYSFMIYMWARKNDAARVEELIDKVRQAGQSLNVYIYNSLLSVYTKSGDVAKAEAVLAEMEKNNMPKNTYTINYLLGMWAAKGNSQKVEELKQELSKLKDSNSSNSGEEFQ